MSTMHDNGRVGQLPDHDPSSDLAGLIDYAGAAAAAAQTLAYLASFGAAGDEHGAGRTLLSVASDAREAGVYLRRAVTDLRGLL